MSRDCLILVAAARKDDAAPIGPFDEINAVARPEIDLHLTDAFADRFDDAWITVAEPADPRQNLGSPNPVAKPEKPIIEVVGGEDLPHAVCTPQDTTRRKHPPCTPLRPPGDGSLVPIS